MKNVLKVQAMLKEFPFLEHYLPESEKERIDSIVVSRLNSAVMEKVAGFHVWDEGPSPTGIKAFFFCEDGSFAGRVGLKPSGRWPLFFQKFLNSCYCIESVGIALLRYSEIASVYYTVVCEPDRMSVQYTVTVYKPPHDMSVKELITQIMRAAEDEARADLAKNQS